jgi:hypothetical protein
MSVFSKNRWFRRFGAVAITVLGLCAVTEPSQPAEARVNVVIGVGVPWGWGYYGWRPYYHPYYYPYYDRAYYPGWRYRRWCWYHPRRCYW